MTENAVNEADIVKKTETVGNAALVSNEEEYAANILREQNLVYVNSVSAEVHPKYTLYTRYVKRILDILISLPVFILLLPFNAIFAIFTFFDVGRPILFKQTRVGMGGKHFTMVKFRNMNNKTDADGKLLPTSQRVTKFGSIMRKLSLDELLNFWSVLKGDMSIIGPRPNPVFTYERMSERHKQRTAVRPGLECPRIIHVEGEETFRYHRTFENDIWYVENVSFMLDVKMVFHLVGMLFSFGRRGKQAKGTGITYFVGYDSEGHAMSLNNYRELYCAKETHITEQEKPTEELREEQTERTCITQNQLY